MLERFENRIMARRGISPVRKTLKDFNEGKGDISSLPSSDTTLFKKDVRQKLKSVKRKIILDKDITPSIFEKLKKKCIQDSYALSQKSIIEILYPLGISNITMARIINELLPTSSATQGSVASMIRFIKTQQSSKQMANELERLLDTEL